MNIKLQTEHHLEFLRSKGGRRGPSESILVKCILLEITCRSSNGNITNVTVLKIKADQGGKNLFVSSSFSF